MISYISDLETGTGMGNYATQLYRHMAEQTGDIENVPLHATSGTPAPRLVNEFYKMPRAYLKASGDTVFLPEMNYAGLKFVPTNNKKLVVTVHDIIPLVTGYAPRVSVEIMKQQVAVMRKADKIIAISESTKNDLIEHLGIPEEKINVVYQGVDTDFFYPRERDEEVLDKYGIEGEYLLYVGTEKPRKNFEGTLELFKKIKEQHEENLTLVKVGSPGRQENRERSLDKIRELGLENDVNFTGFVDQDDLPKIYSSAKALLLLSHHEGFGRPPLEAMACGTLPIVSNKSSLPEVVGELGRKVEPADLSEFEIESYDSEPLVEHASNFNWSKTAQEIKGVLVD